MYTSCPGVSPLTGSRRIRTRETSMSSSAHPVIANDPVTPVVLFVGESNDPIGGADVPAGMTVSATEMGATTFAAPGAVIVMVAVALVGGTSAGTTLTANAPEPVPDAGETCNHETFEATVHGTA